MPVNALRDGMPTETKTNDLCSVLEKSNWRDETFGHDGRDLRLDNAPSIVPSRYIGHINSELQCCSRVRILNTSDTIEIHHGYNTQRGAQNPQYLWDTIRVPDAFQFWMRNRRHWDCLER